MKIRLWAGDVNNLKKDDNEILASLNQEARETGVPLTYAHKLFFLRLLNYAEKLGVLETEGYSVTLSVDDLSLTLEVPRRTTIQSLQKLTMCGALIRSEEKRTFPRSVAKTILAKKIYEKE